MGEICVIEIIKDKNGNQVKEPSELYVIEMSDGTMTEAADLREAVAIVTGMEYLDCESAETEWHVRVNTAKKIGLFILATEEDARTIVYDERIGKIPYSYTDPNPDYDIPRNPELIRVENNLTFLYTLAKIRYINIWKRTSDDYKNIMDLLNLDHEIGESLEQFRDSIQNIPLHKKLGE